MPFRRAHASVTFEHLVRQHQDRVYGYACYVLGDRADAADVTQEVLMKLWANRSSIDAERALPWLLRVARNTCIDLARRRQAYRKVVADDEAAVERAVSPFEAPDASAEAADFQSQLDHALRGLREPYRSIVILREVQDLKYEEICGAMDLPLNTVKVYLHRGRKMLREQLEAVLDHAPAQSHA